MSALFSSPPKPMTPIIPMPAPMKSDLEVQSDASAERQRLASAGGRGSTFLASVDPAPAAGRVLLGTN